MSGGMPYGLQAMLKVRARARGRAHGRGGGVEHARDADDADAPTAGTRGGWTRSMRVGARGGV